jgi:hypothetical protein
MLLVLSVVAVPRRAIESKATEGGTPPVGEEAEVPNADEALRKHVQQEAA